MYVTKERNDTLFVSVCVDFLDLDDLLFAFFKYIVSASFPGFASVDIRFPLLWCLPRNNVSLLWWLDEEEDECVCDEVFVAVTTDPLLRE